MNVQAREAEGRKSSRFGLPGVAALTLVLLAVLTWTALGGSLDAPGAPTTTAGHMPTLQELYDYLTTGAAPGGAQAFQEPAAGPTTGAMKTLQQIYDTIYALFNQITVTGADVRSGKKYFSTSPWGIQTGTATVRTCSGALSTLGRWCNQGNGTVMDMSTGLVWLKKADWGGQKPWRNASSNDDAHTRAGLLYAGATGADLSDGSTVGDWRLPTENELVALTTGAEAVSSIFPYFFSGVQPNCYWSSTTYADDANIAWGMCVQGSGAGHSAKSNAFFVWPVRRGQ